MKRKNKKKILIIGSEGVIGSSISKTLSKKYIIYKIDNIEKKAKLTKTELPKFLTFPKIDFAAKLKMHNAVKKIKTINRIASESLEQKEVKFNNDTPVSLKKSPASNNDSFGHSSLSSHEQ